MSRKDYFLGFIVFYISMILLLVCAYAMPPPHQNHSQQVELQVANPYSIQVRLEIKADWNHKLREFTYHRWIYVPGKKTTTLYFPASLRKVEIWPKLIF